MSSTFVSSFSCVDSDASDRVLYFFRCFTFLLQRIPSAISTVVQLPVLLLTVYGFVWNGVVNLLWYGCFIRTLSPMHISASAARLLSSAYSFPLNFFNRSSSRMLSYIYKPNGQWKYRQYRPLTLSAMSHALDHARWKRWRRSFEFYIAANGVTSDVQKRASLLHTAGMAVQDLFETLSEPGPPGGNADDAASAYDVAMGALEAHFPPKLNPPYERHVFRQMKQESKETVDQFVSRFRRQAENCEFGEQLEENVRDQVIDKCSSSLFRRKLLE